MDENTELWRQYYEKALNRNHNQRTEKAVTLNQSGVKVAIDCGCGTGCDITFLLQHGYRVHGFDINSDSVTICRDRFMDNAGIEISQNTFESFQYPQSGIILANSSLFFANPSDIEGIWVNIESSLQVGGVFAGDFMGNNDSWASGYRSPTSPLEISQIKAFLTDFELLEFDERNELGKTSLGKTKWWHTYSVLAVKRR